MTSLQTSDISYLGTLPQDVRDDVERWRDNLLKVSKPLTVSLGRIADSMGVSFKTAERKYRAFKASGWNVRSLVNKARVPETESALTPEFVDWFKALAEKNQRKNRPAHRKFCQLWKGGAQIPGLDNSLPRHCLPAGTGYDNVQKKIRDAFATTAMRNGLGMAVAKHGPKIFSTRADLWYASHLMIDDMWHDNFVVFGRQIVRVLELDALDVFAGYLETFGCKPRFRRADGTFDNLKESFASLIVASVFYHRGYSPRGSFILGEHGTAHVADRIARILYDRSGGLIQLRESGITGEEQAIIGWRGQGKGNPRFKAALESIRNLKHNELAMLPAQTGRNVESRPEFTHGQLVQCAEELKAMTVLAVKNPARARQLKLNLLDYHADFLPLLMDVYREINARDWHELEGWHKAGNVVVEYRTTPTADNWLSDGEFSSLPAVSRELLLSAAQVDKRYINQRKLSPAEVRARDNHGLVKLPPFVICELLGDDCALEDLTVKGSYFNEFRKRELMPDVADSETFLFESVITTPEGREEQLPDGKYTGYVNPFDLNQLFVCDARKRCLGTAPRAKVTSRTDDEALKRQHGHRAHRIAELKKPLLARHAQTVRDEVARLEHNAEVMDTTRPMTDEEKASAEFIRDEGAEAAADILAPKTPEPASDADTSAADFLNTISKPSGK
jgi:hypothetical protein